MKIPTAASIAVREVVPTGLPQLDAITGVGGISKGVITEISGPASIGKTTLSLSFVREAQTLGMKCLWFNAEWSPWDNSYAEALGVNTKKLGLLQTQFAEEGLDTVLEWVEEEKDTLIVIDAIGAIHSRAEAEKSAEERTIGAQSALMARFCRKIVPLLALNNHALVVLNHEYVPIMATGGRPQVKTSGGAKLEYHKSMWIRLTKTGVNIKQGENHIGFKVEAEIRKNKLAATQRQSCELDMLYGKGFSGTSSRFDDELAAGLITKTGNTFFRGETRLGVGKMKAAEALEALV